VAPQVWQAFGDVPNYVEPFAGSLAVLLGRPHTPRTETVNDADLLLCNFWRAIQADPVATAYYADWPVNEADLLARHKWLIETGAFRTAKLRECAEFYDAKVAGWWVWGLCAWIGSGWGQKSAEQLPHLGNAGRGINRKLPHLGDAGRGIEEYFFTLADRLRGVRVACGDWTRVLGESVTVKHGMTGVFLDPPYRSSEHDVQYAVNADGVADAVRQWAVENGDNPLLRIALCSYGEAPCPDGWVRLRWKAQGGYGSQAKAARGRSNSKRETIDFSPHCLSAPLLDLMLNPGHLDMQGGGESHE